MQLVSGSQRKRRRSSSGSERSRRRSPSPISPLPPNLHDTLLALSRPLSVIVTPSPCPHIPFSFTTSSFWCLSAPLSVDVSLSPPVSPLGVSFQRRTFGREPKVDVTIQGKDFMPQRCTKNRHKSPPKKTTNFVLIRLLRPLRLLCRVLLPPRFNCCVGLSEPRLSVRQSLCAHVCLLSCSSSVLIASHGVGQMGEVLVTVY